VSSAAISTANVCISGMRYSTLSGGPFDANMQGVSNAVISGVVSQDDAASPFATAATVLGLYPGCIVYYVDGTTVIDSMAAGYMGEVRTLRLRTNTATIRDQTVSGGNILLNSAASYVSTGRGAITFVWAGTRWEQIG